MKERYGSVVCDAGDCQCSYEVSTETSVRLGGTGIAIARFAFVDRGKLFRGLSKPCISVEWTKSARERYIRVATMDIVISVGIKNICVAGRHEDLKLNYTLCHWKESGRQ